MTIRTTDGIDTPERPGRPPAPELAARRAAAPAAASGFEPGVTVNDSSIAGVSCRTVAVPDPLATIVYLHGGGFRLGQASTWTRFAGMLARTAHARVVLVDYRLSPENPFPAALLDAAAVFDVVAAQNDLPVFLAGDSAGGNLAAAVAVAASRTEVRAADGLILLSAWTDLRGQSPTYTTRADTDQFFPPAQAAAAAELYLQGHPATDPLASPVLGIGPGFPATISFASTDEILLGDAIEFSRALADVGTPSTLEIVAGMPHAWTSTALDHKTSAATIDRIDRFVQGITTEKV